jgi:hypothetical protein
MDARMSSGNAFVALFLQPEFGIPLLLLLVCFVVWWSWEARLLPPKPAPYPVRPYWMLDSARLIHEALTAGQLGATIQATYTWLSREFARRYGVPLSRFIRFRGVLLREKIPDRPLYIRTVGHLQAAFLDATFAEDTRPDSWLASWRRPRARARAQRRFLRALNSIEQLEAQFGPRPRGA